MSYKKILPVVLMLLILATLNACTPAPNDQPATLIPEQTLIPENVATIEPTNTPSSLERYYVPAYYSQFYEQVVEDSKSEKGLLIYSIMGSENWEPVIRAFKEHYPWINVITLDLDANEVFERYYQEIETSAPTADLIVSSDIRGWQTFIEQGQILSYRSQEDSYLPSWAKAGIGIYALSSDPMVIIYNKRLVLSIPETMQEVSILASAFPGDYEARITTYDAELNATGLAANWFWIKNKGTDGWNILDRIGKTSPILKTSGGQMVQAVGTGESSLGYFVSAITVLPRLQEYPDLGWSYIKDGQPIFVRNMAITQANSSPNSAKLMIDFLLSQEGQLALALGGLTPYRADIARVSSLHLDKISQQVGQENLIFFSLDPELRDLQRLETFLERWKITMNKQDIPEEEATASP